MVHEEIQTVKNNRVGDRKIFALGRIVRVPETNSRTPLLVLFDSETVSGFKQKDAHERRYSY